MRVTCLYLVSSCLALVMSADTAAAHPGSVAFWRVTVAGDEARSQILVSLADFGWTPQDLPTADGEGALTDARRRAMAREVLDHFAVLEGGVRTAAHVVRAGLLSSGALEVIATHALAGTTAPLTLRATFHELTDDSHRVIARLDRHGSTAQLVFTSATPEHVLPDVVPFQSLQPSGSVRAMLVLGVEHIVTGWDHLVFLLCLLVPGGTLRSRAAMVTAFTVAHSVTLLLAALHVVTLPERFIEAAIAVSIAYVAIENLVHDGPRRRWPIAFGFGLIHGFGFAGMLPVLELPVGQFVSSVLVFNLGVEIGQLAIVALAVPLIAILARQQTWHRLLVRSSSVAVCGLAVFWFVERLQ